MPTNYYEILGVSKSSTQEEIRKAYRKLTLKHHPDKGGDPDMFKKINEAYETLYNPEKRRMYDNPMPNIFSSSFQSGRNSGHGGGGQEQEMPEFLKQFFQRSHFHSFHTKTRITPPPIKISLTVSLEEVFEEKKVPIEIKRTIQQREQTHIKVRKETETIYITVPQGIDHGEIIQIQEKGNCMDGVYSNVLVQIKLKNETKFIRMGLNLLYQHRITLKEAVCGFDFILNHVNGKKYKFKNENKVICPHYKQTVAKYGVPRDNKYGNLIIEYIIEFPNEITESQREQLQEIL